jgi:hypothetical protein
MALSFKLSANPAARPADPNTIRSFIEDRVQANDVKYRFVIDMTSLKNGRLTTADRA